MPSIAEALESALEQHETTEAEAAPEVTPEVTTEETKEPRARSEDGKFAKKEPEATPEPTPEPAPRKAPSSWKPAAQEAFLKADRGETLTTDEIKILTQEAERRESDFHKGVSEFKGHSERAKAYDAAIAPYQQHLQSLGVDAPTAINALMRADMTLRTSDPVTKAQYFSQLAKEYNIDLNQLQEPPQVDPQTQYLMNELQVLRNQQQMWQNQARQQEQAIAQDQLASFATPDRPHFDAVRNEMATLLETGSAKDLHSSPASSGVQPGNKGSLRDILAAQFDS